MSYTLGTATMVILIRNITSDLQGNSSEMHANNMNDITNIVPVSKLAQSYLLILLLFFNKSAEMS
jgi:hypothetical protein